MSGHGKRYRLIYLALFFIGIMPLKTDAKSDEQMASETLIDYFDLIRSGNYESALSMWEPSVITRANRLGIEYNSIPVKPDCNSPIFGNMAQLRDQLESGIKSKSVLDTGVIRIHFNAETPSGDYKYQYFARKLGKYFWFIFPQDYYAAGWPVYESKYFRFFVNPQKDNSYNKIAAVSLDNFVEQIAAKIFLSPDRLAILAKEKIDYYLCQNDQEVARITGQNSGSVYDKASDAIISEVFPEFHLVVQLLVNAKLQKLPFHTLPFIEEGLAISLGGKWQRAPSVILDFGEYILDYQVTEIDSVLLAVKSEENQLSDITIPIEACLANYIYGKLGTDKFFQLYKSLSSDFGFDNSLTIDQIKTIIADSFELSWSEFKIQFNDYISADAFSGQIYPGPIEGSHELLNDEGFVLSSSDKWIEIIFSPQDNNNLEGNLMFAKEPSLIGKTSALFDEQYKNGEEYPDFRYGIRVDQNEIGLYDYAINQLKAKYVYNFAPDKNYFDSTTGKISAHFDIKLLDGIIPSNSDYEITK